MSITDNYVKLIKKQNIINERFSSIELLSIDGYFSIVFEAHDSVLDKKVALKFFHPKHQTNDYRLKCFRREAELLEKQKGKRNIVELIEGLSSLEVKLKDVASGIEIVQEFQFIVLELAVSDINKYIYGDASSDNAIDKLEVFREICKGVARIHRENICHRDLKPNNFLIFEDRQIKLSDFGTAVAIEGPHISYEYIGPVGDRGYVSPELICNIGVGDSITFYADIYSIGAILFEMFTKTRLSSEVYSQKLMTDLSDLHNHLLHVNKSERKKVYDKVIDTIVTPHRLPDIYAYNNSVPKGIKSILNRIYKGLVQLNYTNRLNNFDSIIRQINICILILKNEKKDAYRKRLKALRRIKREKKC